MEKKTPHTSGPQRPATGGPRPFNPGGPRPAQRPGARRDPRMGGPKKEEPYAINEHIRARQVRLVCDNV